MDCTSCRESGAQQVLFSVECLNPDCPFFNEGYLASKIEQAESDFDSLLDDLNLRQEFADVLESMWLQTYLPSGSSIDDT